MNAARVGLLGDDEVAGWIERAGNAGERYLWIIARTRERRVLAESALVPIPTETSRRSPR